MSDGELTEADLRAQREALLAEIAEPGHFTKAEAQAVADTRAPVPDEAHRPPASIAADGSVDVSAELTAWLGTVPDGSTVDLGGGVYLCQTFVRLDDRSDLTIRGGTLLRTEEGRIVYPKANPHLWLLRPTRVKVEGLTVRGTNTVADQRPGFGAYKVAHEFDAAIRLERFTDCTVTGLDADGIWGDGVQWQVGRGAHQADCRIDRVGRQGVTLIGRDVLVERVRVEHGRRSAFDIEPDTAEQGVGNIEIRDSYGLPIGLMFASQGSGPIDDVRLLRNTSAGSSVPILKVMASDGARRSNWRLEDHTALNGLGSPIAAVRAFNVDGFTVRRCTLPVAASQGRLAFELVGCGGRVEIDSNDFGDADGYLNRDPRADLDLLLDQAGLQGR